MTGSQLYDLFISQYKRLHLEFFTWGDKMSKEMQDQVFKSFISDLVFSRVPEGIALEALRTTNEKGIQTALELPEIQAKALEIIKLMEESNTWAEFQDKDKKPPEKPPKELTDFDKLLKGFLKVPKPDKKEKEGE